MANGKTLFLLCVVGEVWTERSSCNAEFLNGKLALDKSERTDCRSSAFRDISLNDASSGPLFRSSIISGVVVMSGVLFVVVFDGAGVTWGGLMLLTLVMDGGGGMAVELCWDSDSFSELVFWRRRRTRILAPSSWTGWP